VPLVLQAIVWHQMFGHWIASAYPSYERFFWEEPLVAKSLFSRRAGLFVWSPILVLACVGVLIRLSAPPDEARKRGTSVLVCYLISFAVLCYLNSAWWCWYFGDSFGGRPYIEILSLFMLGLTFLADWLLNRPASLRRMGFTVATLCVICTVLMMAAWDLRLIHHQPDPPGPAAVISARGRL
jgi:hypothetical protein